jgi:hypothetical protein
MHAPKQMNAFSITKTSFQPATPNAATHRCAAAIRLPPLPTTTKKKNCYH